MRCSESSTVKSHSTLFALSDKTDTDLSKYPQTVDNKVYTECIDLISSLNKLKEIVRESNDEDLLYNVNVAFGDVEAYMHNQNWPKQRHLSYWTKRLAFDLKRSVKEFCQPNFKRVRRNTLGKKG